MNTMKHMTRIVSLALMLMLALGAAQAVQVEAPTRTDTILLEGQEETYTATQYADENLIVWYDADNFAAQPIDGGVRLQLIENALPGEVALEMLHVGDTQAPSVERFAQEQAAMQQQGWVLSNPFDQPMVMGADPAKGVLATRDGQTMELYQLIQNGMTYHIMLRYPTEAAEGWGARMLHMAQTLNQRAE